MRRVIVSFLFTWVLFFATLIYLGGEAEADSSWIGVDEVSMTYRSYFPGGSDPLITQNPYQPNRALDKELNLTVNFSVLKYFYWENIIHSMTDRDTGGNGGQFRMVGLEMGFGFDFRRLTSDLPFSFGYYHYSRHLLDTASPHHFPVCDAIEFKLYLHGKGPSYSW